MPNLVYNKLTCLKGDISEIIEFLDGGDEQPVDFNKVDPMPPELANRQPDIIDEETPRLKDLYGHDNWYDWSCEHWGTKWNAAYPSSGKDHIKFDTAWDHPRPIMVKLSKQFPQHVLKVVWFDADLGLDGKVILEDGTAILHMYVSPKFSDAPWAKEEVCFDEYRFWEPNSFCIYSH